MSQIEQLKLYFFLKVQEYLTEQFGEESAEELSNNFRQQFTELYSKNEYLMPDFESKRHGVNPIFIMALFKTLQEKQITLDELEQHVMGIYKKIMEVTIQPQVSEYEKIPNPWSSFVETTIEGTKQTYSGDNFQAEFLQTSEDLLAFDIHRCFYFEVFQKNDMPELGSIQCSFDIVMVNPLKRWIRFFREKTIANGDDRCTFRYSPK
ncbi:MAG: L-2-amino-thiazoline-4-carboxylic acid hydrolase [Promethearchaeota archaeon]|jgi:hypothetical protein